jgi:2-polyprenyl-3-methyl-5-hydroxy-6-metoxy-1,4-benzoquinol methylase
LVNIIGRITPHIVEIDQSAPIESCNNKYSTGAFYSDNYESPSLDYLDLLKRPDIIICSDVIEHIVDPDILHDFIKVLAAESKRIIFSTPDRDRLRGTNCTESLKPKHIRE